MVRWIFIWCASYLLPLPVKITIGCQMDQAVNSFCYIFGEIAVNKVFYSKFKLKLPHPLATIIVLLAILAILAVLAMDFGLKICTFHLVYLLKACRKFNGWKWLAEMNWKNWKIIRSFWYWMKNRVAVSVHKKRSFPLRNSSVNVTKSFLLFWSHLLKKSLMGHFIFCALVFACSTLIPEQILLLDINLIKLHYTTYFPSNLWILI